MASKDYDDLLESFMNNSQKVYNEDRDSQKLKNETLPSSYSVNTDSKNKPPKTRGRKSAKKARPVKEKSPFSKCLSNISLRKAFVKNFLKFFLTFL